MTAWTPDELRRVGGTDELQISSRRPDGSIRPFVTIWAVRVGDEIFVRSAYGSTNPWYRRALASGVGLARSGEVEREVEFAVVAADDLDSHAAIDAAYHAKYDRYGARIVGSVVGDRAREVTLRLEPVSVID